MLAIYGIEYQPAYHVPELQYMSNGAVSAGASKLHVFPINQAATGVQYQVFLVHLHAYRFSCPLGGKGSQGWKS